MTRIPPDQIFDIMEQMDVRTRAFDSIHIACFRNVCRMDYRAYRRRMAKKFGKVAAASSSGSKRYRKKSETQAKLERMLARLQIRSDSSVGPTTIKSNIPASIDTTVTMVETTATKALQIHSPHKTSINVESPIDANNQSITLATLPREMRDHIYSFIGFVGVNIADSRQHWSNRYVPSVARVSQSMAAEFKEHYYQNATFIFDTRTDIPDTRAEYPARKQKASELVKTWNSWMTTLDTADVERVRHLMFYGTKDIVRLKLSTKPLKVTCSVKSKYGGELDPACKLVEDVEKMRRNFDRNMTALNLRQTRFTSYDLGRMCQAVFDARGQMFQAGH
ncbi:hypothetical protein LTS10_008271 [Elasticomyces elasticus]|nr:hypothetical protein LTS10_008271 [Elasticomyces elasticus]